MQYGVKLISPAESSSFVQRDTGFESFYRLKECSVKSFRNHIVFFQSLLTLEDKKERLGEWEGVGGNPMVPCAQLHKNPTADRIRAQRCICMLRTKACAIASSSIYKPTRLKFLCVRLEIKISGQHTTWSRWCHTLPPYQQTHTHTHTLKLAFMTHSGCAGLWMKHHTKQRRPLRHGRWMETLMFHN